MKSSSILVGGIGDIILTVIAQQIYADSHKVKFDALTCLESQKETCSALIFKSMKQDSFIVGANINMLKQLAENPECL